MRFRCPRSQRHRRPRRSITPVTRCQCQPAEHWNPASLLHPVDLWVLIDVNGHATRAKRDTLLERREDDRVYITTTGHTLKGQFRWMYV